MTVENGYPFTLEQLAERWECSRAVVRKLCIDDRLRHFRVGTMYRITVEAALEYEAAPSKPKASPPDKPTIAPPRPRVIKRPD